MKHTKPNLKINAQLANVYASIQNMQISTDAVHPTTLCKIHKKQIKSSPLTKSSLHRYGGTCLLYEKQVLPLACSKLQEDELPLAYSEVAKM